MTVVIGSEWEVPPRLSALRGNVPMSVRSAVSFNGLHDVCSMRVSHVVNWLRVVKLKRGQRVWITSEYVVEWLHVIMLPKRCYQLSAAGRPKRGLRARCRNSQRAAFNPGGGRTEAFGPGAETPPVGPESLLSIRGGCRCGLVVGCCRLRDRQRLVSDAMRPTGSRRPDHFNLGESFTYCGLNDPEVSSY